METMLPNLDRGVPENVSDKPYYILSDLTKEDKEIRHKIKLNHAVKVQEFERGDTNYKRSCWFCGFQIEGKRADILDHFSKKHNLTIGNPQNLVFIDELITVIEGKLESLRCLFCDKTFPERFVLKEHMRKKFHKRINPCHREYDKFYIVNYLEPDKSWLALQRENDRYVNQPGTNLNSDEEYADWNEKEPHIRCLFCTHKETDINLLCLHMDCQHDFDFAEVTETFDFYQKIKLVNYIRKQLHDFKCIYCDVAFGSLEDVQRHMHRELHFKIPKQELYNQPEFFFPTYENDAFLYHIDDVED